MGLLDASTPAASPSSSPLSDSDGLDVTQIVSHVKHYDVFVCGFCNRLVSLDAVVATCCSHPYCRKCLERYVMTTMTTECYDGPQHERPCHCPGCRSDWRYSLGGGVVGPRSNESEEGPDVSAFSVAETMLFGAVRLLVRPLHESQPLAYRVLCQVQVSCCGRCGHPEDQAEEGCAWEGDYEKYLSHTISQHAAVVATTPSTATPAVLSATDDEDDDTDNEGGGGASTSHHTSRWDTASATASTTASKRPSRSRTFMADSVREAHLLPPQPQPLQHRSSNGSIEGPRNLLVLEKESIRKSELSRSLLSESNHKPQSTPDSGGSSSRSGKLLLSPGPMSPSSRPALTKSPLGIKDFSRVGTSATGTSSNEQLFDVHWNDSKGSFADFGDGDTTSEDVDDQTSSGRTERDSSSETFQRETILKADKLKKQANAKFNKGDLIEAQKLYTEGINVMEKLDPSTDEDFKLLSNMHSNRAATYYREKKFSECIKDCDYAIEYEPAMEKAWIRKRRALSAAGDFDEAYTFLRSAIRELPESNKIQEEFARSKAEMEAFLKARELMDKNQIKHAWLMLKTIVDKCETAAMLAFAAKVAIAVDESNKALEIINKVLNLNPESVDGLELRGFWYFLSGATDRGVRLLQDACNRHKNHVQLERALARVQRTHDAYENARLAIKEGQYPVAIEQFSVALKSCNPIPPLSPLYAVLKTGRSESFLLSHQYLDALKECQEVLALRREYAPAWIIRSEVLIALGKVEDARHELSMARRTWGADNPTIEEGLKRVDFELRVVRVDTDIAAFLDELENGTCERLRHLDKRRSLDKGSNPRMSGGGSSQRVKYSSGSVRNLNPPKQRPTLNQRSFSTLEHLSCSSDEQNDNFRKAPKPLEVPNGVKPPRQRNNESPTKRHIDENRKSRPDKASSTSGGSKDRSSSISRSRKSSGQVDGESKVQPRNSSRYSADEGADRPRDEKKRPDDVHHASTDRARSSSRYRNGQNASDDDSKPLKRLEKTSGRGDESPVKRNSGDEGGRSRRKYEGGGSSLPEAAFRSFSGSNNSSSTMLDQKQLPHSVDGDVKATRKSGNTSVSEKPSTRRPSPLEDDGKQRRSSTGRSNENSHRNGENGSMRHIQ